MPKLVQKYKPNAFIFAVSNNKKVLSKLQPYSGLYCQYIDDLSDDVEVLKKVYHEIV